MWPRGPSNGSRHPRDPVCGAAPCHCSFYFLGDDDLLEILGQSKNPAVIQSHLKKLFAGIHKVGRGAVFLFSVNAAPPYK